MTSNEKWAKPASASHYRGNMDIEAEELAMSEKALLSLAGISYSQLRYWRESGLVEPSISRQVGNREVRVYRLREIVEVLVAAQLRRAASLQQIRAVVERLRGDYEAPLREIRFALEGQDRIFFQHPSGEWEGAKNPNQLVWKQSLTLDVIRQQAIDFQRQRNGVRAVGKQRSVHGSKPTVAGSRVPVEAIVPYLELGWSNKKIAAEFPALTTAEVGAVRDWVNTPAAAS